MSFLQEIAVYIWMVPVTAQVILPLAILVAYLIWKTAMIPINFIGGLAAS